MLARKRKGRWLAGCASLLMALACSGLSHTGKPSAAVAAAPYEVIAYLTDERAKSLRDADAQYLTQINYSFALVRDDAVVCDHWKNIGALTAYKKRHPHIKLGLSVGGWGADGFSQAAATEAGREMFTRTALDIMERYGFTVLDIDWEYPGSSAAGIAASPEDKQNFTLLLRSLREGLDALSAADGVKRYLGIAVGASAKHAAQIECAKIAGLVDQVNLMTYDLWEATGTTGHHTNLTGGGASAQSAVSAYESAGIPHAKMLLGGAFYGYQWSGVADENNGLGQRGSGRRSVAYTSIAARIAKGAPTFWDEAATAPYLYDGDVFISYDDERSLMEKSAYVKRNGLRGMMFWEYGLDETGALVRAVHSGLQD